MTVEDWGTGRPDYHSDVLPSRPVIQPEIQEAWEFQRTYTVSPQSSESEMIYTVPEGYTLTLDGGLVSVKDSCINMIQIFAPNSIIGDLRFDMRGDITIPASSQVIDAETEITVYIYNNDTIQSDFSLALSGVLNEVL
jgi:hypothetical protein